MIFYLEDDENARELVLYALKAANMEGRGFPESRSMFEALKDESPDLILLDIMLPGDDGITVLKKLKKDSRYSGIPVIMTTAKGTEFDKVTGLDLGADDYLTKPFGMMEMISRIKAVLRRTKRKESELTYYVLRMNDDSHKVFLKDQELDLTIKEYELLKLFMKNVGIVFSREKLLAVIWDEDFMGETRTVDVHIGTLRNKLGSYGKYIETVRGVGYRMKERV